MDMGNAKQQTIWSVDYVWVDERVKKYLGLDNFEFIAAQETSNDVSHTFSIDSTWIDRAHVEEEMAEVRATKFGWMYRVQLLLEALYLEGVVEEGDYVVSVSW